MPHKQTPPLLYELAMKEVLFFVLKFCSLEMHTKISSHKIVDKSTQQVLTYLSSLPKFNLRTILQKWAKLFGQPIFNSKNSSFPDFMVKFLPLGVPLDITLSLHSISFPLVDFFKTHSTHLVSLTLTDCSNKSTMRTLFKWLNSLKHLAVKDNTCIGLCLDLLSVDTPLLLPTLESIDFFGVPNMIRLPRKICSYEKMISKMLMVHYNLKEFSFYGSYKVFTFVREAGYFLKLQKVNMKNVNYETCIRLDDLVFVCPSIKSLDLLSHFGNTFDDLKALKYLEKLAIKNRSDSRNSNNLFNVCLSIRNLTELSLSEVNGIRLKCLACGLPSLSVLKFDHCDYEESVNFTKGFNMLKRLHIIKPKMNSMSRNNLVHLLSDAALLEDLILRGNFLPFSDEIIDIIMRTNPLLNLYHLLISKCSLTVTGIFRLLENESDLSEMHICSNSLSLRDNASIKQHIKSQNLNLTLLLVGSHGSWAFVNNRIG